MTKLVIVESPKKCKYIGQILGQDYQVIPSFGHVRDLPAKELGIDVENNFAPKYQLVRSKNNPMTKIKEAANNAEIIYLASDPDREGEAIAWHIYEMLPAKVRKKCVRITFKEITKEGVLTGINAPRELDMEMVNSQQARRILDRLAGFEVSPILWTSIKGKKGLSAGRVQSAALKLLYDRHIEIEEFIPEDYFTIHGVFHCDENELAIETKLVNFCDKKVEINNKKKADELVSKITGSQFQIKKTDVSQIEKNPPQALQTTTMLQEANRLLKFSSEKTMKLAQELYEGLGKEGLITYIRTDSTRVSEEAKAAAAEYIAYTYGLRYLATKNSETEGAQDAHEAIRPTDIQRHPNFIKDLLNSDQYKLYSLIYNRFLASQMAPAKYDTISLEIEGQKKVRQLIFTNVYTSIFAFSKQNLSFPGYRLVYQDEQGESEQQDLVFSELKKIISGQKVRESNIYWVKHETEPPKYYSEASLIKNLDKLGIGRPSTYASIIKTLLKREYAQLDSKKRLVITSLGIEVANVLKKVFPTLIDYSFTAKMEKQLDLVAGGSLPWHNVLQEFYQEIQKAKRKNLKK